MSFISDVTLEDSCAMSASTSSPFVSILIGFEIALFSNSDEPVHFSYRRYLENSFRDALGLVGSPVHLVIRARKGMKRG